MSCWYWTTACYKPYLRYVEFVFSKIISSVTHVNIQVTYFETWLLTSWYLICLKLLGTEYRDLQNILQSLIQILAEGQAVHWHRALFSDLFPNLIME